MKSKNRRKMYKNRHEMQHRNNPSFEKNSSFFENQCLEQMPIDALLKLWKGHLNGTRKASRGKNRVEKRGKLGNDVRVGWSVGLGGLG